MRPTLLALCAALIACGGSDRDGDGFSEGYDDDPAVFKERTHLI